MITVPASHGHNKKAAFEYIRCAVSPGSDFLMCVQSVIVLHLEYLQEQLNDSEGGALMDWWSNNYHVIPVSDYCNNPSVNGQPTEELQLQTIALKVLTITWAMTNMWRCLLILLVTSRSQASSILVNMLCEFP